MTVQFDTLHALADRYFSTDRMAYAKALQAAEERARCRYFDQHIVRSMHGHYWVADEGDYECEFADIEKDVVYTVPSTYSDEY